ncbi:O-antigen ligase family protein [Parapedobacter defluvii]|uniref:O-antigen ligase family protein n=1 Tax=Parapedobacter defluvii TaxID=2045106 RepID=UPI001664CC7A|nr:O-antigen ligase family protein [Parapedobacter defluvii]
MAKLNNDYVYLVGFWGVINILQLFNPQAVSIMGWLHEVRFTMLNWLLIAPLAFILLDTRKDLNNFLKLIIILSVISTIYGMKQLFLGVSAGEQAWLESGPKFTHVLFGQLRVFSFYTDAGQFGASQAHIGLIALILAFGPFKRWKKICLFICAGILLYGMLISGTRGALFALVSGGAAAIFLSKKFKIFIIGSLALLCFIAFLKYTTIGQGSYQIRRLRTALNPEDASLNVRFENQQKLRTILADLPFGGGVGVSGSNGTLYNPDKILSTIPPDSYWVKVWVMYGITGMTIWFIINMYLIGKCCGIVWRIRDDSLRVKLIALTSGSIGIFICSYGNEVINGFPSSVIVYLSWGLVIYSQKYIDDKQESAGTDSAEKNSSAVVTSTY